MLYSCALILGFSIAACMPHALMPLQGEPEEISKEKCRIAAKLVSGHLTLGL